MRSETEERGTYINGQLLVEQYSYRDASFVDESWSLLRENCHCMGTPAVTFTNAEEKGCRLSYSLSEGEGSRWVWVLELCCYSWNAHFVPSRPGNCEEDRSSGIADSL